MQLVVISVRYYESGGESRTCSERGVFAPRGPISRSMLARVPSLCNSDRDQTSSTMQDVSPLRIPSPLFDRLLTNDWPKIAERGAFFITKLLRNLYISSCP